MLRYTIALLLVLAVLACGERSAPNGTRNRTPVASEVDEVDDEGTSAIVADAWARLQTGDSGSVPALLERSPSELESVRWRSSATAPTTLDSSNARIVVDSVSTKAVCEVAEAWLRDNEEHTLEVLGALDAVAKGVMASHRTLGSQHPYVFAGLMRGWLHQRMRDAGLTEGDYAPLSQTDAIVAAAKTASLREVMTDPPG